MRNLEINKQTTIAFTGHRTIVHNPLLLKKELLNTITEQYNNGYRIFISGAAKGFDLFACEAVLELQNIYPDIISLFAVPYAGHHKSFNEEDKQRYISVAENVTSNIILSSHYDDGCFLRRNDYMINNCSLMIAYYNNSLRSGTGYTVRRAKASNIPIINLYK